MSISTVRAFSAFVAIVAFVSSAVRADQKEDVKLGKICPDKVECQLLGDVTNDRDPSVSFLKLIIAPKDHKTVNGLYIRTEKRDDKKM